MLQHAFDEHYEDYPVTVIGNANYRYGLYPPSGQYLVENVLCAEDCRSFATVGEMNEFLANEAIAPWCGT